MMEILRWWCHLNHLPDFLGRIHDRYVENADGLMAV